MKKFFLGSASLLILSAAIVIFQIASCKKSIAGPCPEPIYPVSGLWEGTYQTDQVTHAPTYISFAIYPDGTFLRRSKVVGSTEYAFFKGTWTLNGTKFEYRDTTVSYSGGYLVSSGILTFSSKGDLTNGTWKSLVGQSYTGTFPNMKRIN